MGKLTDRAIRHAKKPLGDGGNLWIFPKGAKRFWIFRYTLKGRSRSMGLGSYPDTSLARARQSAAENRKLLRSGIDPLEHRRTQAGKGLSFVQASAAYLRAHRRGWSRKQAKDWCSTLRRFARPVIGSLPVCEIDTEQVLLTLSRDGLWSEHPALGKRVQERIERVLDFSRVKGWRSGENPARWKGNLDQLLPRPSQLRRTQHRAAMDYAKVGAFLEELRNQPGIAAKAVELLILTACRLDEVRNARWTEIDMDNAVWVLPAERTKVRREHRVPLSAPALELLRSLPRVSPFVFQGMRFGRPLARIGMAKLLPEGVTLHGFRSAFRDWAAEQTSFPERCAEQCLGHLVGTEVERAYRRTDLFDQRKNLMDAWANYLAPARDKVVSINRR